MARKSDRFYHRSQTFEILSTVRTAGRIGELTIAAAVEVSPSTFTQIFALRVLFTDQEQLADLVL